MPDRPSNDEYYERNRREGNLHSILKDGPAPNSGWKGLLSHGYHVVLVVFTAVSAFVAAKLGKQWRWKVFIPYMILLCGAGWLWEALVLRADPHFPAWLFRPESIVGIDIVMTLEDWLFYPVCAMLFYAFYRLVEQRTPDFTNARARAVVLWGGFAFCALCTIFFGVFGALCGRSLALFFGIPALVLWLYARTSINARLFLYFFLFVVAVEVVWDWTTVAWIHQIPGLAWAVQWSYVTFDAAGEPTHSSVFLSYTKYPWAWLFENPIEITPWFGIVGAYINFIAIAALDRRLLGRR